MPIVRIELLQGRTPTMKNELIARVTAAVVVHGTADMVLPISHGRASRQLLSSLPVELTYHEYQMGHEVSQESLADVTAWLSAQLDKVQVQEEH